MNLTDWVGTIGVTILLLAFFLNLTHRLASDSSLYILLNLLGAAVALVASILLNYVPFIILEAAWVIVSAYQLIKNMMK